MHGFGHFIDGDARNWCARRRVVWRFTRGLHGRLVLVRPGLWSFNFLPSSTSTIVLWYGMVHLNPFTFDKCSLFIIISCISLLFFQTDFRFQHQTVEFWSFWSKKTVPLPSPGPWQPWQADAQGDLRRPLGPNGAPLDHGIGVCFTLPG